MYRAVFRVLEPYLFRGPGEFDPSTRGVYSSAFSFLVPSPSTVAGALATTFGYVETGSMEWDEAYSAVLGAKIRGPYLRRGLLYVENRINEKFIRLDDVQKYCYLVKEQVYGGRKDTKKMEEILRSGFSPRKLMITGIGLMTRTDMRKIADEERGLIYTASFIDYFSDTKISNITIEFDIISGKIRTGSYAVRLGGEGRASLLEISESEGYICRIPERADLLYVLSPVLYETGAEFIEQLKAELGKMGDVGSVKVFGKVDLLGAGYSEVKRRRKPIYQALLPGSVIILEKGVDGSRIYEEGIGAGKELGFGSVIPVGGGESGNSSFKA
jgi:CRISPR-associated protein Cmr3